MSDKSMVGTSPNGRRTSNAFAILARWRARLVFRRQLLKRAQRSVRYWWTRSASASASKRMLREAIARRALRRQQVAEAERVVARYSAVSTVSPAGVAFVASFEGFRSKPYRDPVGVWTIGYGETRGITPQTSPWTRAYALNRLRTRLNVDFLRPVLDLTDTISLRLEQNEADALASLVYNLGPGILASGRTMGDALRSKSRARIADAFLIYDKAGTPLRSLPGLTRRRRAERELFLK